MWKNQNHSPLKINEKIINPNKSCSMLTMVRIPRVFFMLVGDFYVSQFVWIFFIFLWMFHWRFTVQLITICRSTLFHIEFMTSFIHWILFLLFHDTWDTWIVQTLPPSSSIPQHLIMRLPTSERHVLLFPRDFNVCHSSLVRAIAWMKFESTVT